jgi:hypothetical protein
LSFSQVSHLIIKVQTGFFALAKHGLEKN